jgi:tetratricopeptide (TPR) repeat protein
MLVMILGLLYGILELISLILLIIVLVKLFQNKGALHGILGIISCGWYPFIWGWIRHKDLKLTKIMIIITSCMVLGFLIPVYFMTTGLVSGPMGFRQLNLPGQAEKQTTQRQSRIAQPKPREKTIANTQLKLSQKQTRGGLGSNFQIELTDLNNRLKLNNENGDAYYNRGLLYAKNGQYEQAIKDFSEVIKLNPRDDEAYCNRGNANFEAGKLDLALADYNTGLKINANDADLYYNRGLVYLKKGLKEKALADLRKAGNLGQGKAKDYLKQLSSQ